MKKNANCDKIKQGGAELIPTIARFYGMAVKMYFQQAEHNPPHFHVIYGEYVGVFDIQTLKMIEGDLPKKA